MKLNKAEYKALKRIEKWSRGWRQLRWYWLVFSFALLGVAVRGRFVQRNLWLQLDQHPFEEPVASVFVYMMARGEVLYQLGIVLGLWLLAYTAWNWRGRPVDTLLLRYAREFGIEDETSSDAA